jgi:hypothetical protein
MASITEEPRTRAYLYFYASNFTSMVSTLQSLDWDDVKEFSDTNDDHVVIVRANVVNAEDYNLIVPVDVVEDSYSSLLDDIKDFITENFGVDDFIKADVFSNWFPNPPHSSDGWINKEEHEADYEDDLPLGYVNHSPGWNAWG